jgi:hypothetical protein
VGRPRRYRQLRARGHAARPRRSSSSRSPIPAAVITDIEAIAAVAKQGRRAADRRQHAGDALSDPPIDHGADIVVHSLTKFLGGHGNSIGGIIVDAGTFDWSKRQQISDAERAAARISRHQAARDLRQFRLRDRLPRAGPARLGPALSPFNAFLILTGIETLPLRMQRIATTPRRSRNGCGASGGGLGELSGLPATATTTSRANTRRRAPARCSPSASRAATRPASSWCRT